MGKEAWRKTNNRIRPRSSLGDLTPQQFVDKYKSSLRSKKLHLWLDQFSGEAQCFDISDIFWAQ
jgi:hypothetical protein